MTQPITVMKFGGTSVGDAECIRRTAEIIAAHSTRGRVVTVVSAMSGVTNSLVAAARQAESGDQAAAEELKTLLWDKHRTTVEQLIVDPDRRTELNRELLTIIENVESVCRGTAMLRELTPRALDSISSTGEALSSRILASVLIELGYESACIQGSDLIVSDGEHGNASPLARPTADRVRERVLPLLEKGTIVIVSGFMAGTVDGFLTTLGRGGSDYSATILGAAIEANEIIIWTDVEGVMTADPRLVPDARTLHEISYNEAAALAYFGAKVLHPKTLRPVVDAEIPVWIRNSFAPEKLGTKITRVGHPTARGVKAITAISDVSLITISGRGMFGVPGVAARTFAAAARAKANVLLISQSSSEIDICFIVSSNDAKKTVEMLRETLADENEHEQVEQISVDSDIAIVAVVGEMMRGTPGIAGRVFRCLGEHDINVIAIAQGSSEYNVSFVVHSSSVKGAVRSIHNEFGLEHPASLI